MKRQLRRGIDGPSCPLPCSCSYHITDTSFTQFNNHMFQVLKFSPKRTLKVSRAFSVVSRGRILACYANFCWDSLLGSYHSRMAKQETENFASVSCCYTRPSRGLTPQFLLGKLAWGLLSVNGIEPTATPLVSLRMAGGDANQMPTFRTIAIFNPRGPQSRYHTACHLLRRTHDGRFLSLHGTVMARYETSIRRSLGQGTTSMSQRLPSKSLKFTKVGAKVPPQCLKGCPLSHLSLPRFGPRYHLSVSKVGL